VLPMSPDRTLLFLASPGGFERTSLRAWRAVAVLSLLFSDLAVRRVPRKRRYGRLWWWSCGGRGGPVVDGNEAISAGRRQTAKWICKRYAVARG
jgi:hypothetical protein